RTGATHHGIATRLDAFLHDRLAVRRLVVSTLRRCHHCAVPSHDSEGEPFMITTSAHAPRWARAMMLILPAVWIGLIIGISFIEAPLKFTAPGITIPLGLGIGRRVFLAMNITEIVIGIVLLIALVSGWRSRRIHKVAYFGTMRLYTFIALAMLLTKTAIIRPLLAVETDAVLAGTSDGGSLTHSYYIGVEAILFIALVLLAIAAVRGLLAPTAAVTIYANDDASSVSTTAK